MQRRKKIELNCLEITKKNYLKHFLIKLVKISDKKV